MSVILMAIKPEYVNKIFLGNKKFEFRKKLCRKKIDKIIVYSSFPVKKVVGELLIQQVLYDRKNIIWHKTKMYSGISKAKYDKYFDNCEYAVAYEIKKSILYDKPKELNDYDIKVAPQSYVYLKKEVII